MPIIAQDRRLENAIKWTQYPANLRPMWVADMDFQVCPQITEAVQQRGAQQTLGYTASWESAEQSVIDWCLTHYDWQIKADWIVWTPGIVPTFNLVNSLFTKSGAAVLTPTPNYPPLLRSAEILKLTSKTVPQFYDEKGWRLDIERLATILASGEISVLSLANPANPLGYVLDHTELEQIAECCRQHDVIISSDEIHCDLVYPGHTHIPAAKIAPDVSITLMAASKTFNIAGLNTAFAIIPDTKLRTQFKQQAYPRIGAPTFIGLAATEAAFTHGEQWRQDTLAYLKDNRDLIDSWAKGKNLDDHYLPAATHLYWLKIPTQQWIDSGTMPSPGSQFGKSDAYSRINFACDRQLLEQALTKLDELSEH